MAYKKFIKRGDKLCGPYYYESYRDKSGKVKKKYIGTIDPDAHIEKKNIRVDVTPTSKKTRNFNAGKNFKILLVLIFFSLIIFLFMYMGFFINNLKISGYSISENSSDIEQQSFLYNHEKLSSEYDFSNVNLKIKTPEKAGDLDTKNKNKRMDFTLEEGEVRLYFDLLNYSEFVENIAEQIVLENTLNLTRALEINATQTLVNITNITEIETNATINEINTTLPLNITSNETNITIPQENITINKTNATMPVVNETIITIPVVNETITETNETTTETIPETTPEAIPEAIPETNAIVPEENITSEEQIPEEQIPEPTITGNMIGNLFKLTGSMINSFVSITSRVIGIDINESLSENQSDIKYQTNISQTNQVQEFREVSLEEVKESLSELSSDEVGQISEDSTIPAENFDIIFNETLTQEKPQMKWGYQVKLNDLKFMAKIEVTSNESISIYSSDSLRIGRRNILSFADLANSGYKIRFVTPSLEIPVENISVGVNVTEIIQEIVMNASNVSDANEIINESEAVNESEVIIDEKEQKQVENKTDNENKKEKEDKEEKIKEWNASSVSKETEDWNAGSVSKETENSISNVETGYGITGGVIRFLTGITGRIISGFSVSEGQAEIEDIKYTNTITVYIEKDFNQIENSSEFSSYQDLDNDGKLSIGDIIDLDPTLIIIPASDAEELDSNRSYIRNIYEEIKEKDDNWTIINESNYVRVSFTQNLTRDNDITVFAKASNISGECYDNETEILTLKEVDCENVDCNSNDYICENEDKKENATEKVASIEMHVYTDYNNYNPNNYINFSVDDGDAEDATIASMVMQRPEKPCLHRLPGSNPGCGESSALSQKCFVKKWKYFNELSQDERVATLNSTSGEVEYQKPLAYQEFDNSKLNGEMYKIELEDGSELSVSEKHRVYASESKKENKNSMDSSSFVCFVEIPTPILNKKSSYVNSLIFLDNASATKSSSLRCMPKSSLAFGIKDSYFSKGINFILLNNILDNSSISELDSLLFSKISDLCLRNSCLSFSGANKDKFSSNRISAIFPFEIKILNKTLESITTSIHSNPLLTKSSCIDLSTLSANSLASSSVNLDLDTIFFNLLRPSDFDLCFMNCTTISDISRFDCSACFLNSSGILTQISAMNNSRKIDYKKLSVEDLSNFSLQEITDVYSSLQSGKEIYFLNSFGEPVLVKSVEKVPYSGKIYDVDVENDVVLVRRRSLVVGSTTNDKLQTTDYLGVWSGNSNPESAEISVFRKDSDVELARFVNITAENYYKVYLTNLSENESYDTFDLRILGNGIEFDYIVDPFVDNSSLAQDVYDCGNLTTANAVYTLNTSVLSNLTCFYIKANNVTLDCNGFTINYSANGTVGYGVYSNKNYTTVKNCNIKKGKYVYSSVYGGINFVGVNNGTIYNNTIINNNFGTSMGIYLSSNSNYNNITNNIADIKGGEVGHAFALANSNNNYIGNNNFTARGGSDDSGVYISTSSNNIFISNNATANGHLSYYFIGSSYPHFNQTLGADNYANGKPVNYTKDLNNLIFQDFNGSEYGQFIFLNCSNITFINSNITNNGLSLFYFNYSNITGNNITVNGRGIYLYSGTGNIFDSNNIIVSGGRNRPIDLSNLYLSNFSNINTTGIGDLWGNFILTSSSNNSIDNIRIKSNAGLKISADSSNVFNRIFVNASSYSIYQYYSSTTGSILMTDSVLNLNNGTNFIYMVYSSSNFTFVNVSFNKSGIVMGTSSKLLLNVKWWLDVNVTNTTSELDNALTNASYGNGTLVENKTTPATGVVRFNLTEYIQNFTGEANKTYMGNYIVNVTHTGYNDFGNSSVNMSDNIEMDVVMTSSGGDTVYPLINFTSPTPNNETTTANTSVEINVSINEANLNEVKYNWNGTNFTLYNESLVLMMNFENLTALGESSTKVVDLSKYGNNGTVNGGAFWNSSGKYGGGYSIPSAGSSITLTGINTPTEYTISVWKLFPLPTTTDGWRTIIAKNTGNYHHILFDVGGNIGIYNTVFFNTTYNTNYLSGWHQITTTASGSTTLFYIDGAYVGTSGSKIVGSDISGIGNYITGGGQWCGPIDELLIWNRTLSTSEIYQVYVSNLNKFDSTQWYLYVNQSKNSTTGLSNGAYTYFASAKDAAGNENLTDVRTVTIGGDSTPPAVNITYPLNGSAYTVNVSAINYTISETTGYCWYSNNSGVWNSSPVVSAGTNFTNVISVEGWNNWTVYCNDSTGNVNSSNVNFTRDISTLVTDCMTLSTANSTYTLYNNIVNNSVSGSDSGCIVVSAQNITFDCAGYYISSTSNNSGVYSAKWNTTVKGCNITMGQENNTNSMGIEMTDAADYSTIVNNTIIGNMSRGIEFAINANGPDNSTLENNTIEVSCGCIGIYLRGSNNNTLKGNNVTSSSSQGIYIYSSTYNYLIDNIGYTQSTSSTVGGISIAGDNNILINNTGTATSKIGIYLDSAKNNTLTNNTGISNSGQGIYIGASADNNTLTNNVATSNSSQAMFFITSNGNTIIKQNVTGYSTGSVGIYLRGSNNNTFSDCVYISGVNQDVQTAVTQNLNNTFINCSYNTSKESVGVAGDTLIRKWYYSAYVNQTNGSAVSGANVSAYNSSANLEFSSLTNSSGYINRTEITEYVNIGGTRAYYNNYTINASLTGYNTATNIWNISITQNLENDTFTLSSAGDTVYPLINFTSPTPSNETTTANTSVEINVSISEANLDEVKYNWNGSNFTLYNESLVLMMNFENNSALGECYDNSTEILTESGWKYFKDLKDGERVMTLNNETGEKEWQVPTERQEFNNDKDDMYRIELVDGGELLVSNEHKVYAHINQNSSENSDLLKIFTTDCFFNSLSSETIDALILIAKAKKSASLGCLGINDRALCNSSEYSKNGMNLITFFNLTINSSNSSEDNFVFSNISDLCLINSVMANSGEYKSCSADNNFLIKDPFQKNEYKWLVSNTNFIYNKSRDLSSFSLLSFAKSPSFNASSSVNSLSASFDSRKSNNSNLFNNFNADFLKTIVQSISECSSINNFNSLGIGTFNSSINCCNNSDYLNISQENLLLKNSQESPLKTYILKNSKVFIGNEGLNDFSLQEITDVYSSLEEGKEIYFLNSLGEPVLVKSIEKVPYSGKIYDVDVENDIVLVRRRSLVVGGTTNDKLLTTDYSGYSGVWSGNSNNNNFTADASIYNNSGNCSGMGAGCNWTSGKYGMGVSFDGVNDNIYKNGAILSGLIPTTAKYTLCAWFKAGNVSRVETILSISSSSSVYRSYQVRLLGTTEGDPVGAYAQGNVVESTAVSSAGINADTTGWHHVCAVYSNNVLRSVYLDGGNLGTDTTNVGASSLVSPNRIAVGYAVDTNPAAQYFTGMIDEPMIYNYSLSDSEVYQLYISNLQKYNSTQWYLYVNQSRNSTDGLDTGTYTYFASAKDAAGNENLTDVRTVTIGGDSTPPAVNITYPLNGSAYTVNVSAINYTVSETNGYCWYSNNSGVWNSSPVVSAGTNFTNVLSVEGSNNWTVYCNDSTGNVNSSNVNFTRDISTLVTDCMTLSTANSTYTLYNNIINNSVSGSDSGCIVVSAQNITLDCAGYYISSTSNNTGVYSAQWNTTVKGCNITMGQENNTNSMGIEMTDAADYSTIVNNTIWDYGSYGMYYGINTGAEYQNITGNNVNVSCVRCYGIYLTSSSNNTLTGNNGTSNSCSGIFLFSANNNTLVNNFGSNDYNGGCGGYTNGGINLISSKNNTLIGNIGVSNSSTGIRLAGAASDNNIISGNNGTSNSGEGIVLSSSNYNNLTNNIGTSNSNNGIYLTSSNYNNLTSNTGTSNSSFAVYLLASNNNTIVNQNATGYSTGSYGIVLRNASYNNITDCIYVTGVTNDTYLYNSTANSSIGNIFLNCSYNLSKERVLAGNSLIRKWYYQAYVNETSGTAVSGANVSAYNVTDNLEFSYLTNSSGWINRTEITEYVNTGGTRAYYNNYTVNASLTGYNTANQTLNITLVNNSLDNVFTLSSSNTAPTISLTSPSDGNSTIDRTPTFVYSGSDGEGNTLAYDINITCIGGCSVDNRLIEDYIGLNYTPTSDLKYLYDNNHYYNWSVRTCENATTELYCSGWASRIINISAYVYVNLTTSAINFGSMIPYESRNTTNNTFTPISVNNAGNCYINMSVNSTSIWSSVINPSTYFMMKVRNYSGNASFANTSWFNLPPITGLENIVQELNYSANNNSLAFDVLLEVPDSEASGNKSSEINFIASLGE